MCLAGKWTRSSKCTTAHLDILDELPHFKPLPRATFKSGSSTGDLLSGEVVFSELASWGLISYINNRMISDITDANRRRFTGLHKDILNSLRL